MTIEQFRKLKPSNWVRLTWGGGAFYQGWVLAVSETPVAKTGSTLRKLTIGSHPKTPRELGYVFDATKVRLSLCKPSRRGYLNQQLLAAQAKHAVLQKRADKAVGKALAAQVAVMRCQEEIVANNELLAGKPVTGTGVIVRPRKVV
jgi:hypothetical protein